MSCESFHESDEIDRERLSLYDTDLQEFGMALKAFG